MTGRVFSYHIFWKEYRQMRGFWLAVFGLTVVLQFAVYAASLGNEVATLYGLALCFSALYALGCGAAAFAAEHENETYGFLRALPTRSLETFFSKVGFTLVSAPLLLAFTALAALLISQFGESNANIPRAIVLGWINGAVGGWMAGSTILFLWAALFSLILRHPVHAAVFGGLAGAFSVLFVFGLLHDSFRMPERRSLAIAALAVPVVVAAVDLWLGARWFREPATRPSPRSRRARREQRRDAAAHGLESMPSRSSSFGHLVWLQWWQSRGTILILTATLAPFLFSVSGLLLFHSIRWLRELIAPLLFFSSLVALAVVPLAGASVFAGDWRQHQFRFLADRGVLPKFVWWSRHPVWLAAIFIWLAIAALPLFLGVLAVSRHGPLAESLPILRYPSALILCLPLAYCAGQFCSMMFRSGIISGTLAIVGSLLLALWAFAMAILNVPLVWSVVPIPVVLLVATRVRTYGWMLERNHFKSWLPVVLVLAVPAAAILAGVCLHRAFSIPLVDPGFDVAAFTAPAPPEADKTAEMYREAYNLLSDEDREEEAVALLLKASRRSDCADLHERFAAVGMSDVAGKLAAPLLDQGNRREEQGDLDAAVKHYLAVLRMADQMYDRSSVPSTIFSAIEPAAFEELVDWTEQLGQTSERILAALREMENITGEHIPMDNSIKARYVVLQSVIQGDQEDMLRWTGVNLAEVTRAMMFYWIPWEQARARRLLRLNTWSALKTYDKAREALAHGKQVSLPVQEAPQKQSALPTPDQWLARFFDEDARPASDLVVSALHRRATRIQMALAAWQLDHDSLPERLEQLEGEYLGDVPLDPYSGEPFVYFPNGVDQPIASHPHQTVEPQIVIEADKPFFWSIGPAVVSVQRGELKPLIKYRIREDSDIRRPASPGQVWAAGKHFFIPQPR